VRPAAPSDTLLIIVAQHLAKMKNHDFRAPIFGVGREVAINRGISILPSITTNHHDLPGSGRGAKSTLPVQQTVRSSAVWGGLDIDGLSQRAFRCRLPASLEIQTSAARTRV
jgi:hypothetical protein